jgi:hypothetical protein
MTLHLFTVRIGKFEMRVVYTPLTYTEKICCALMGLAIGAMF